MFVSLFPRLKEGILSDVFVQKAVVAWNSASSNRIMVSPCCKEVRVCINMWLLQKTTHVVSNQMATEVFMRRERRRLFRIKLNLSGPKSEIESGPSHGSSNMMRSLDVSFYP